MVTSLHVEVPSKAEESQEQKSVLGRPEPKLPAKLPAGHKAQAGEVELAFRGSLIDQNRMLGNSRWLETAISLAVNAVVLLVPLLAGLMATDTINLHAFQSTFLAAPPPPPPPPAPAAIVTRAAPARRVFESEGQLIAPTVIPNKILEIKEAPLAPDVGGDGVPGGVPGGVSGGTMSGVIGGVIGGMTTAAPVAPVAPKEMKPKAPVRVGGRVKEPRLLRRVDPVYPALARQLHLDGTVVIDAVLDEQGNVTEMRLVSGQALLVQAAMEAVRQWKYEPTYLNDQPVPIALNVTVIFKLNR